VAYCYEYDTDSGVDRVASERDRAGSREAYCYEYDTDSSETDFVETDFVETESGETDSVESLGGNSCSLQRTQIRARSSDV